MSMLPFIAPEKTRIMASNITIVRDRQLAIRRELDRRGISLKTIAFDAGIHYSTLLSYFPDAKREPHLISGAAFYSLCGVLPPDLLSLLLPDGFQVVRAPEDVDHDQLADAMADYLAAKQHAHHPDSPDGREIAECEDAELCTRLAVVKAAA